jgi:hypothetical protein
VADRYWVGGGSSTNWNATGNTNWASSSGGANNQSVPTTGDTVIFDANSGSGVSVMNLSVSLVKMDAHAFTGTLTHNGSITITITGAAADSVRLPNTGTYTAAATSSLFTLTSTSGTTDITSNGKRFGALTMNGVGGTFRILDAIRVDAVQNSIVTLTNGSFNANNFNVTAHAFSSSNSNTRTLTMGSGTWTIGGNVSNGTTVWTTSTTTGLSFNKDTANLVVPSNGLAGSRTFIGGGLTFNVITIDSNTGKGVFGISGGAIFSSMSVGAGVYLQWGTSGTHQITSAFTFTGTSSLPITMASGADGTAATLLCTGTCSLTWGAVRDMTFSGGTMTGTNVLDLGNNTGISVSTPAADNLVTIASDVAAIKAKTDNLPSDPADASVIAGRFDDIDSKLGEVWRVHGLDVAAPLTVTPTSKAATGIAIAISGDGETTSTLTRS